MQTPTQHPTDLQATPPKRHLAGWAFAVAFIVVLLGVGIAALVLRTAEAPVSDEPVTETTVADTSTETTVVETPIEPTQLESLIWSRVSVDGNMGSVTVGGPGLVAVGTEYSDLGPNRTHAAVWNSPDGITWTQVYDDEAVFGGDDQDMVSMTAGGMASVTAGGPGLVAVGTEWRDVGPNTTPDSAVWTSPDGITWTQVHHDEAVFGGDSQDMVSLTVGGPGLVAVGSHGDEQDADAAVWTSPDGFTWSRVPYDEAVFGGDSRQAMSSVTAGGPGLVAVGDDAWNAAAVWTSPDGFTWSRVPHDEAVFGGLGDNDWGRMFSVTTGGPGLVAVGEASKPGGAIVAAVWTSPDGFSWSRVPHDDDIFGTGGATASVTTVGSGLVAVGEEAVPRSGLVGAAWTSPDGFTWSRVPHDDEIFGSGPDIQQMHSVTARGTGLVTVGGTDDDGAVWVATPND